MSSAGDSRTASHGAGPAAAPAAPPGLIIACGALSREIVDSLRLNGWSQLQVTCLPAIWHNHPQKIPEGVRARSAPPGPGIQRIFVAYGDCGTGGLLDRVLEEEGVRAPAGPPLLCLLQRAGDLRGDGGAGSTLHLTDYLTRHFERLIIEAGPRSPPALPDYWQLREAALPGAGEGSGAGGKARAAADFLHLAYHYRFTDWANWGFPGGRRPGRRRT